MKKVLIFLLVAVMTILAGCGKETDIPVLPAEKDENSFAKRELIIGVPEANINFDPYDTSNGNDLKIKNQIYDYLVEKDEDGNIVGSLAERYEVSTDGMVYTFYLRHGVKFSNGTEFKASDAKFSIEKAIESPYTMDGFYDVSECVIVDEYTVEINMKVTNVSFLEKLTNWYGAMISEAAVNEYGDQFGKTVESAVGTGPYIPAEWKSGELCVLKANIGYFKGEPSIKNIRYKAITDTNAAVIALQTGEIDLYASDLPGISVDAVSKDEKLRVMVYPSNFFIHVAMNTESGPFTDKALRQAVACAVDRQKMLTVGEEGMGTVVDSPAGPGFMGNPGIETWYESDLEKSKQLVKDAGMEGKSVTIKTRSSGAFPKLATALQDELSKIGLQVDVLLMETNAFLEDVTRNGKFDIAITRYGSTTRDVDEIMVAQLYSESVRAYNNSRYVNSVMDELLMKARSEMDTDTRKNIYADAIKLYTDDAVQIPLYYVNGSRAFTKDLTVEEGYVEYDRIFNYKWNY